MDLVDYSQTRFNEIREEFRRFAMRLEVSDLTFIPISALIGDNVVTGSSAIPWYEGTSLVHHLEDLHVASDRNLIDVRFPVQYVIRPHQSSHATLQDFRGYAGTLASGVMRTGDEVTVLRPRRPDLPPAQPSPRRPAHRRHDLLAERRHRALPGRTVRPAAHQPLDASGGNQLNYRLDVNTLHRDEEASGLSLNEIG